MVPNSGNGFKHDLTSVGDEYNCPMVRTFFGTTLLGNWDEDWPFFQSCGHCGVFQICWCNEFETLMASSFRDLNSFAGISLHPLALQAAVLLKGPFDFALQNVWLWVTKHAIAALQFITIFFVQFFHVFFPSHLDPFSVLLNLYHLCPLLCPSLGRILPWCFQFFWRDL